MFSKSVASLAIISSAFIGQAYAEDRPLGLVEHINAAPGATLQPFDYVYENDKIDLRPSGQLLIAYFDRCEVESFNGGLVKIKSQGAKVSKGGTSAKGPRACQTASLALSQEAREAGAAVKRVTPFPEEEWREVSIAVGTPRFIWPSTSGGAAASVSVYLLEADPTELVWQGTTTDNHLSYPEDAPALKPGMPYKATVSYNGKVQSAMVFSYDPGLNLPDSLLTTAVPLGL
ncbi:MAG: hypothetical protein DHS20C05_14730 [Hyphococcus sp.]|nr:MAG: hypothetical protein DHS20C05_14730 [Marinicaulis sp.]